MKVLLAFSLATLILMGGCQNSGEQHSMHSTKESPSMLEVKIKLTPENIKVNQKINIEAVVSQGNEKVNDADEVVFEIGQEGQKNHEMINGKLTGNGVYSITKTFSKAGKYTIVSHVTARDLHNMPKKEIVVNQ